MFGPFRKIQRSDRQLDARQLNKLLEIAQRLGNLNVAPPLVLNKGKTGFQLALNQLPDAALVVVNSGPNSDGYYDASVVSWDPASQTWIVGESVWLEDGNPGDLAAGVYLVAVDTGTQVASGGETATRRILATGAGPGLLGVNNPFTGTITSPIVTSVTCNNGTLTVTTKTLTLTYQNGLLQSGSIT